MLLVPCGVVHGDPRYTQSDFGGVGLLQTPTARMAPAGELSVNANRTEPYSRYSFSAQPLDWLEGVSLHRDYQPAVRCRVVQWRAELQGQGSRRQSAP